MARTKKKKLSLEELCEMAMVEKEQQPYKVSDNWVWTKLKYLCELINGDRGKNYPAKADLVKEGIPFINAGVLKNGRISYEELNYITQNKFQAINSGKVTKNDILYCLRGTLGKNALIDEEIEGAIASSLCILRANKEIEYKYLFYMVNAQVIESQKDSVNNGTAQPNLSGESVKNYIVPLPPLAEQQRIVERIESLFEKLDTAKELAQNALDSFEKRKAAILHKAFTGELTAKWRKENDLCIDNWKEEKIKEICDFRSGYAFNSKKFTNNGFQVIRMGNLYNGVLDLTRNPVYYSVEDLDDAIFKKSKINKGDILLTLTGTKYKRDYGHAVLIESENDLLLNQRIVALTPIKVPAKFLLNYLKTNMFRDIFFSNETGGVNQGNVSSKFVENITIPIPPTSEQREIVRILDKLLTNEQQAKELCDVIERIDIMKKSILSRAFRGELGTNNPEEESAIELLKEVLKEKM